MSPTTPRKRAPRKTVRANDTDDNLEAAPASLTVGYDPTTALQMSPEVVDDTCDSDAIDAEIRLKAYELFLARGGMSGDELADWFEAETQVRLAREASARQGLRASAAESLGATDQPSSAL
ncbi:MAG: DUF2934 domain-containing protein [bacterium]